MGVTVMHSVEVPRVSTTLRAFMPDGSPAAAGVAPAPPSSPRSSSSHGRGPASLIARNPAAAFDVDREVLRRREQLEEREREKRASERDSTAAGGDMSSPHHQPEHQQGVAASSTNLLWQHAPSSLRSSFLSSAAHLLGGQLSSSDLHEAATTLLPLLTVASAQPSSLELSQLRSSLTSHFGFLSPQPSALSHCLQAAHQLNHWRLQQQQQQQRHHHTPTSAPHGALTSTLASPSLTHKPSSHPPAHPSPSSSSSHPAFGAHISFSPPALPASDAASLLDSILQQAEQSRVARERAGAARATAAQAAAQRAAESRRSGGESEGQQQQQQQQWGGAASLNSGVSNSQPGSVLGPAQPGNAGLLQWVLGQCVAAAASGGGGLTADDMAWSVVKLLQSNQAGEEVAAELFNLLGDTGFDFIQALLQRRKDVVSASVEASQALREEREAEREEGGGGGAANAHFRHGATVTIQTDTDRAMEKLKKKEERKHARLAARSGVALPGGGGAAGGALGGGAVTADEAVQFSELVAAVEARGNGWLDGLVGAGDHAVPVKALPAGTKRHVFKGYEEVHVPPAVPASKGEQERLVPISEMEPFAQLAFQGFTSLNRIQSRIFQRAFYSNENLLVCAPTGAGKTNIAMIAVLHEIGKNMENGVLNKASFKIVYVAPMKALAAEMTAAFGRRLAPLQVAVREVTGDMQLSKKELEATQMIVTTPEKWDVITRKSSDTSFSALLRLLIIDEVHLLNDERGPVIETLVARTLRQVESSQNMIRIVGLSATLPNYKDVAQFLRVNLETGLFFFDASYRPVPLAQQYIGVSERNFTLRNSIMHDIAYAKASAAVKKEKQAMVFVHSRKDTVKTARLLVELAQQHDESSIFLAKDDPQHGIMEKEVHRSRNRELAELYDAGFGIHHAGMLRSDRSLTEKLFSMGLIKVLVCTATLAWGVNLPAHTVIIKGTQLYDSKAGGFKELGMLDVMQIFGRAGRPQFDTSGEGIIITSHNQLPHYLRLMTHQMPIESQFVAMLKDNLNAEVVLGTVTNLKEACAWLGYTYLHMRMQANPLAYGMTWKEVGEDPGLVSRRRALITEAARALDSARMLRFDLRSGQLYVTELGRVASHFYLRYESVQTYNEMLRQHMSEAEVVNVIAHSSEFENIVVREEESMELITLRSKGCPLEVKGGPEDKHGKINVLIQSFLSRAFIDSFSLIADTAYVSASLGRIVRALFEITQRRGWCSLAALLLELAKAVDHRQWMHQHPLRQFESVLSQEVLYKLEDRNLDLDRLAEMEVGEIAAVIRSPYAAKLVAQCVGQFPYVDLDAHVSPITRTVLQVTLYISPTFEWNQRFHGNSMRWWIWVEDCANEHIYHTELFTLSRRMMNEPTHLLSFTIPIFEPLPSQYVVRAISDSWLGASSTHTISFKHLILPELHPPHTELLPLRPLPSSALGDPSLSSLYSFSHFNPIQTQAFHTLYHTDCNVLLGAPTGSGKTISAELAMMRLWRTQPGMKVIYIAPLKALVRERIKDWSKHLMPQLNKIMVELTGDATPDMRRLMSADVIVATPEKWDGITRSWHSRSYAQMVGLMVMDEIHLLGQDRGPVLEVIVSRMRYIAAKTDRPIRFLGLSTALANARDLADWLGIQSVGLFNFKPSVRPVPLDVHIQGFPGRFYCPRMATMNKPLYAAIRTHSPVKPVLVFVSSRRQTRLTALEVIQYAAADEQPRQFVHCSEEEMESFEEQVSSPELRHTLRFGIGLHHAGLTEGDRALVERLFADRKIQVLVCTSTLAWGVNLPAHLVVVKGTEFFDGKQKRYVDYPITDVLQMMGRAGRPQFDREAKAVILVHEPKKSFFKKFLYEPFPVESSLHLHLHDHLNAEIASGSIHSHQDALHYLTWTFFFRRLLLNPSFYDLTDTKPETLNLYLSDLIQRILDDLHSAGCISVSDADGSIRPLPTGLVSSQYYLHFTTAALFTANLRPTVDLHRALLILCGAAEFDELPVRHNEDTLNAQLSQSVRWPPDARSMDDPHTKTNLLLQAHYGRVPLPMSDYVTDLRSVLDQSMRILQAIVDVAATKGYLHATLTAMRLTQMTLQGLWYDIDSPISMLPGASLSLLSSLSSAGIHSLPLLLSTPPDRVRGIVSSVLPPSQRAEFLQALGSLPRISLTAKVTYKSSSDADKGISAPMLNGHTNGQVVDQVDGAVGDGQKEEAVWTVEVHVHRVRPWQPHSLRAYTPAFSKPKDEGWWLIAAIEKTSELLVLKRMSITNRQTTRVKLPASVQGQMPQGSELLIGLVSDCYLGLDQFASLLLQQGSVARAVYKTIEPVFHTQ